MAVDDMQHGGRPNDSTSSFDNIQQIRNLLEKDTRMMITEIDCCRASAGRIIHDMLKNV